MVTQKLSSITDNYANTQGYTKVVTLGDSLVKSIYRRMLHMTKHYEPELKQEIIRLYLEEGRTMKSLTEEYNLGKGTFRYWLKNSRKECDKNMNGASEELGRLRKQNAELLKENQFLKKAAAFFAKEIE